VKESRDKRNEGVDSSESSEMENLNGAGGAKFSKRNVRFSKKYCAVTQFGGGLESIRIVLSAINFSLERWRTLAGMLSY
jgi:hypothetical protein